MLISTKGRYALRVMAELAEHKQGEYVPLKEIAKAQDISMKYLESIATMLSKADIIEGLKGKGGGYRLKRLPKEYSIGEILDITEPNMAPVSCLAGEKNTCKRAPFCPTLPVWKNLDDLISNYLHSVTIADLG